ncbi:MAG: hypothetical protein GY755_21695 [Chloroflexi bacterium]|nr:hypothetical protein [Chloroflexota bacterium]
MDIEHCVDRAIDYLNESDDSQWWACYYFWEAQHSGYSRWAELLGKACGIGDDQARNRANAWSMYLILLSETNDADKIRENSIIKTSHFIVAYKFHYELGVIEAFEQAAAEGMSVRAFGAFLADLFGDDPESRFVARYGRFAKEIDYMLGMAETYGISKGARRAMKLLKGRL